MSKQMVRFVVQLNEMMSDDERGFRLEIVGGVGIGNKMERAIPSSKVHAGL